MNEVTLPPAPNWYLSTTLASARDGTIAWGARACLVVAKRSSKDHKALNYDIIPDIHNDRINSITFSPDYGQSGKKLLVTGGNDASVKVWDLDKLEMNSSKSFVESEQKVIGVDWSKSNPNMICAISTQGSLLTWQFTFKTCQIVHLGKITATCISCSPHNPNLIAIGSKSGLIYIVNPQGKIIHKLRGHDYEIVSLSWCPTPLNIFKEDFPKDYLLASGAKDRMIFIWRAATDGRYETKVSLPNCPQNNTKHRTKLNASPFTALLWLEPGILVANSAFGELLSLKLASIKRNTRPDWKVIHGNHSRGIFSISSYIEPQTGEEIKLSDDENWRTEKEEMVLKDTEIWTTGQERQVICVVPGEENDTWKIEYNIPTLSGYIYCISPCPVDTSRIAFGVGDGMLRVWNLSEPHETTFDIIGAWQDIKDRVTAIAWYPDKENLLAYGTSEGRVGVYDIFNVSKRPVVFKMHHRKTIYRLEWGPSPPNSDPSNDKNPSTYSLYCCGDGELTCFNYDKPQQEPTVIIKKSCTEISWKPDYSCLAVGHDDGSISFLNRKLESCEKTIFLLKKPVEYLTWHPDSTVTDLNFSHFRNYLAASNTTPIITIFDMSPLTNKLNNDEKCEDTSQNFYKVIANLSGHSDRIFSLAWSPHISGYLVSGSADKTVQVWKIEGQELLGTYTGHCNGVHAVMWSPLDHNFIISGSSDSSLRIWRYPDQKVILPTAESTVLKSKIKKSNKKSTPAYQNDENPNDNGIVGSLSEKSNDNTKGTTMKTKEKDKKRGKKTVSYFPNYRKQINDRETVLKFCLELTQQVKGFESSHTIFGNKDVVSKILEVERDTHWEKEQSMMTVEMSLWDNKLKETITKAMETQSLSDFMVSLAPNLSMKFWREVCEAYSNQLVLEGNPVKAASYLLVVHKIREAINILMQAKLYREAHAIAKCKLDPRDEILKVINTEWLAALLKSGSFEEAALCSISNGDISEAARILARRKDALTLETAGKLASMDKNQELSDSIVEEALNIQLSEFNYDKSRELLTKFPSVQYRWIQVQAHEEIRKKVNDDLVENWLKGESSYGSIENLKKRFEEMDKSKGEILSFYKKLDQVTYPPAHTINQTEPMLWLSISRDIALAAAAPDEEKRIRHVVGALGAISQYELLHPVNSAEAHNNFLIKIVSILESVSPAVKESMFYFEEKEKDKIKGFHKSLRVYLCLGLLNWLLGRINTTQGDKGEIPVEFVTKFIEESLEFALDRKTVEYWMRMAEVAKLESLLASSGSEDGEENKNKERKQNELLERLEEVRRAQKKFFEEYVCAPSPMLIYGKANELGSFIENEQVKMGFMQTVSNAWKRATDILSED